MTAVHFFLKDSYVTQPREAKFVAVKRSLLQFYCNPTGIKTTLCNTSALIFSNRFRILKPVLFFFFVWQTYSHNVNEIKTKIELVLNLLSQGSENIQPQYNIKLIQFDLKLKYIYLNIMNVNTLLFLFFKHPVTHNESDFSPVTANLGIENIS